MTTAIVPSYSVSAWKILTVGHLLDNYNLHSQYQDVYSLTMDTCHLKTRAKFAEVKFKMKEKIEDITLAQRDNVIGWGVIFCSEEALGQGALNFQFHQFHSQVNGYCNPYITHTQYPIPFHEKIHSGNP
ncbi:hypothetical protein ARMGADRAFT_1040367 [Armillaria gallica]|uniref:Uncharacterized protein n=1 Tax=Armillaria gallica TaxID=47427 RepID=A0A2H3CFD4_ARMGA|nr:hypothetical protein ARMGADRAFT_1040367 [Armillaria gallica]